MASNQQYIDLNAALETINADHITQRTPSARLRTRILAGLADGEDIREQYLWLTSGESTAAMRYSHLEEWGLVMAPPTASGYPPVTPADHGARAFVGSLIRHVGGTDGSGALVGAVLEAFLGDGGEEEREGNGRAGVTPTVPTRGMKSDAGPGKRFYCHSCGSKRQFRRDMKRHFGKHFPGHEVDALDREWEVNHGRWGPWTDEEARSLGRDLTGMRERNEGA